MVLDTTFRTSSRCSADSPQCVEVALRDGRVVVRDTKTGSTIDVAPADWQQFVTQVKAGAHAAPPQG